MRDEKGEEMHKSKGNAIWFDEAAEEIGVDAMRWLFSRANPDANLNFGYHIADEVRRRFICPCGTPTRSSSPTPRSIASTR